MPTTPFHALYTARELSAYGNGADRCQPGSGLAAAYASSDIEVYPYQIAAAMFALRSPYLKGAVLADEGSLRQREQTLFLDGIRLDVDAENAVKEITEQADLRIDVKRQFVIEFMGGDANG